MIKKMNKKGFTLAELLIVVAIIGVLVAISIPIFTSQLQKARLATNQSNARSAYAAALTRGMIEDTTVAEPKYKYTLATGTVEGPNETLPTEGGISEAPQDWTLETHGDLGNAVATAWYISFKSTGTTFYPVFPS